MSAPAKKGPVHGDKRLVCPTPECGGIDMLVPHNPQPLLDADGCLNYTCPKCKQKHRFKVGT